jgi:hypothetical protein
MYIDLSNYLDISEKIDSKTILTCVIRLDRNTILETLQKKHIYIKGKYYKVPEDWLLECLFKKNYGNIMLHLEEDKKLNQ